MGGPQRAAHFRWRHTRRARSAIDKHGPILLHSPGGRVRCEYGIEPSASVPSIFRRLFKNAQAATLIESLIAGSIATATVSGMGVIGNGLRFVMGSAANAMNWMSIISACSLTDATPCSCSLQPDRAARRHRPAGRTVTSQTDRNRLADLAGVRRSASRAKI